MTPVSIVLIVIALPLVCGTLILLALILKPGRGSKTNSMLDHEESQLMQELHQGLSKMEKRIESLETLLLDQEKKVEKKS